MNRYDIKPEGLGEINIDLSDNGEWVRFEDIEYLLVDAQKTSSNSDYAECAKIIQQLCGALGLLIDNDTDYQKLYQIYSRVLEVKSISRQINKHFA